MAHTAERYHDICAGHRVHGQGGKCEHLHGHNYRIHFVCEPKKTAEMTFAELELYQEANGLDDVGRVIDFTAIKEKLCMWLEEQWDHKFIIWEHDPWAMQLANIDPTVIWAPFNPTAENMAEYLVRVIGPQQLQGTGVKLVSVRIEETAKCSATFRL